MGTTMPLIGWSAIPSFVTYKKRVGSPISGTPELEINSITFDSNGKLKIQTDALVTSGLKLYYAPDLSSPFTEVTTTSVGTGGLELPSGASATQGTKGFYKVVYP